MRPATVELLASQGAKLMITVDCGIGCADEIALATERGMDTIVVDHHQIPPQIPKCVILHPLVEGETYPFKKLAAVGVAFKFACGFVRFAAEHGVILEPNFEKRLLDLVAIATVTDVMPLIGENRALEKFGLIVLNRTKRPGLKALIETSGLSSGRWTPIRSASASRSTPPAHGARLVGFRSWLKQKKNTAALVLDRLNRERRAPPRGCRRRRAAGPAQKCIGVLGDGWPAGWSDWSRGRS